MGNNIRRVPYADRDKVNSLPLEAKTILDFARGKIPINEFKELEHEFVSLVAKNHATTDLAEPKQKPVASEKMQYGGPLTTFALGIANSLGLYNPDSIPYNVYDKMSYDPTIALADAVISNTITGLSWRIDCEDDEQRNLISYNFKKIFRRMNKDMCKSLRVGFAVGEKVWKYDRVVVSNKDEAGKPKKVLDDEYWCIKKIKFAHPASIRIRIDDKGNYMGIIQQDTYGNFVRVNEDKLVHYEHDMEYGNWFGRARYKNVYPAWYWGMVLIHFMLKYYERRGQPLTKMRAPSGSRTDANGNKVDNLTYALKVGQAAVSNSVVVLPQEFDKNSNKELWDMAYLEDQQRGEMFIDILNFFDSRKMRGMFIPDRLGLASDGSPHSASGASAGDTLDVFILMIQSLANDFKDVADNQVIPQIQQYNFSQDKIFEAHVEFEKIDYSKKLLIKDLILRMIMLSAGTLRDGRSPKVLPSIRKLAEMLDIPMDKFGEMFDEYDPPGSGGGDDDGEDNIQNNPNPTTDKKEIQDRNNATRTIVRKERSERERSIREKKS